MEWDKLVELAMQLGVIPAIALFLVFKLHAQNQKLIEMIDRQEQDTAKMLQVLVQDLLSDNRQAKRITEP